MNKEIPTINVGMVGHIDHGKTTLLYKLSGKWTDTHSEELKRGITIKLGYADIVIYKDKSGYNKDKKGEPIRHVSFVDAPGHEMLMATMLSGAAMIDAAILVVAANEGIKPQTIEDAAQAKKNYQEIKELLKGRYDDAPIIPVSAQQEVNLDKIYEALANVPLPERNENAVPIFIVARSFDINRPGTKPENLHGAVLGGTLKQGKLKVGDEIEIKPGRAAKEANQIRYHTLKTRIVKLFKGSNEVNELTPGGSMSIETELDMALGKSDALLGNVASLSGKLPEMTNAINVKFKLFPEVFGVGGHVKAEAIKPSEMLMLSVNTSMSVGVVRHVRKDIIEISLKMPLVPFKGDNVGIGRNVNSHWRLIGYGEIV